MRNSSYTPKWSLFTPTHSDQQGMEMTEDIGFCDLASLHELWDFVMKEGGVGACPTDTFLVYFLVFRFWLPYYFLEM